MSDIKHCTMEELEAGMEPIKQAPQAAGELVLIVRRPENNGREPIKAGVLDTTVGLVGDNWQARPSSRMPTPVPHPDMQLTVMNKRVLELIAPDEARWPLAGDQLYVDMDISYDNMPAGTQLMIGDAVIEVTDQPHTGCKKFVERFGAPAVKWVNSKEGKRLRLRGLNAKVVKGGSVRLGDMMTKR